MQSYDFDAIDYLLKPIDFERFLKACLKAKKQYELETKVKPVEQSVVPKKHSIGKKYILVKSGKDICKVNLNDLLYIEATGNYVKLITQVNEILSLMPMKELIALLAADDFIRIHKSYIISFRFVDKIEKHQVKIGSINIPIGNVYKNEFFKWLENKS